MRYVVVEVPVTLLENAPVGGSLFLIVDTESTAGAGGGIAMARGISEQTAEHVASLLNGQGA